MPRRIESHDIAGPAGNLEALLEEPEAAAPLAAVLLCHPHPKGGGTMHNKVVYRVARGLRAEGRVVLRFNFRGVGASEGEYDQGVGELEDARAALLWLRARYPHLSLELAGFSFGSRIALKLGCTSTSGAHVTPPVTRVLAVGVPTTREPLTFLGSCTLPKTFISSRNDEYAPMAELDRLFLEFAVPRRLVWIDAADHFFAGALDELEAAVRQSVVSPL